HTPRSSPLPYTTLFQSRLVRWVAGEEAAHVCAGQPREVAKGGEHLAGGARLLDPAPELCSDGARRAAAEGGPDIGRGSRRCRYSDRKSTRLNSSHGSIS